jgi:serine/threonine protein kinase
MGEVYRARDARLGRDVALKVLASHMADNAQAVARFEREARAVAALSHPNILAIHDIGREGTISFAVMELLLGDTLRDRLKTGAIPLPKALDYATQIAQGLAAAHAKGITHRDLKPENVFITTEGLVKILDFGLAKIETPELSEQVTAGYLPTGEGTILGTAPYMSPEQALGKTVDPRSDVFSFGSVLYEMVTGKWAFAANSVVETLHRIIHDDPPKLEAVVPSAPRELVRIVSKCLAKDAEGRYQSTRDLVVDVRTVAGSLGASPRAARSLRAVPLVAGILAVIAIAMLAVWWSGRFGGRAPDTESQRVTLERVTSLGSVIDSVVSPDGKSIAYVTLDNGLQELSIRELSTGSTLQLVPHTRQSFWGISFSPDGSVYYGLRTPDGSHRDLYRITPLGGTPQMVVQHNGGKVAFSPDGKRIAYVRDDYPQPGASSLLIANVDGSDAHALLTRRPPEFLGIAFAGPSWSPDGKVIVTPMEKRDGLTAGTFIAVHPEDGTEEPSFPHYQFAGVGQAAWTSDGAGLVAVASTGDSDRKQLWWLSARREARRQITNDFLDYRGVSLPADASSIVSVVVETTSSIWTAPIDGAGDANRISSGRYDGLSGLAVTPDGRILYQAVEGATSEIWVMDESGVNRRKVTTEGEPTWPVATPDGKSMVFVRKGTGLWRIGLDGRDARSFANTTSALSPAVTPDGKWVFFSSKDTGVQKLWKVPVEGGDAVQVLNSESFRPSVSPDGRQIALFAYPGIVVMPVDGTTPTSTIGLGVNEYSFVRWTADGKALLIDPRRDRANIWFFPLSGSERPVTHFVDQTVFNFVVSADGKRFIIARGTISRDAVRVRNFR